MTKYVGLLAKFTPTLLQTNIIVQLKIMKDDSEFNQVTVSQGQ